MGRYCVAQQVKDFLAGNGIAGSELALEYTDSLIEEIIAGAESEIDDFTGRQFHIRRLVEVKSGRGTFDATLREYPLFTLNALRIRYAPFDSNQTYRDGDSGLFFKRETGKISITPGLQTVGMVPQNVFTRGESNITIDAWVGHCMAGDNYDMTALANLGFYDFMIYSTDGTTVYFDLAESIPFIIGGDGDDSFDEYASLKMFKGSSASEMTDDSVNWTVVGPRRVSCAAANFDSAKIYRLAYVPSAIASAAVKLAVRSLLLQKASRDDTHGSGGASSRNVSGFSESYQAGYMYGDIAKKLEGEVFTSLKRWSSVGISV